MSLADELAGAAGEPFKPSKKRPASAAKTERALRSTTKASAQRALGQRGVGLIRADAIAIPLRDASVDLIVTSPPYFALRSYQDGGEHYDGQIGSEASPAAFLAALWAVTDECWRVLKPSGSLWVNLGDKYSQRVAVRHSSHQDGLFPDQPELAKDWKRDKALGLTRMPNQNVTRVGGVSSIREKSKMLLPHRYALGCADPEYRQWVERSDTLGPQWICRADVVWAKPNGLPESVTDRVRSSHEYWFHLTKSERYYAGVDAIREPHSDPYLKPGERRRSGAAFNAGERTGTADGSKHTDGNPLGKLPGSVWTVATEPLTVPDWLGVNHYAAFPTELPRRIILGWTPTGICTACGEPRTAVVDRPGGSQGTAGNTTAGRSGNGSERNRAYRERLANGQSATITGYSCACPDPSAPTRPAVVLDPFNGTGTTVAVAKALGRFGVGLDLSADYLRLARWRVDESPIAEKVFDRTFTPPKAK